MLFLDYLGTQIHLKTSSLIAQVWIPQTRYGTSGTPVNNSRTHVSCIRRPTRLVLVLHMSLNILMLQKSVPWDWDQKFM